MGSVNIRGQSFYFKICAKHEKWQSPGTRSLHRRQAHVFGSWPVARRIYEIWRSGSKSNHIVASRTARELPSARHPAVCATTLNAALYPHSLTRNERSSASLLRPASLVYYTMITRTTQSVWPAQDEIFKCYEQKLPIQQLRMFLHLTVLALCLPQRSNGLKPQCNIYQIGFSQLGSSQTLHLVVRASI
jgi:hypothetical protein